MSCNRIVLSAAVVLGAAAAWLPMPASAASVQARYCILHGGGEGSSGHTDSCVFSDYQQCLQAAASGGNCVENIDYHGDASASESAPALSTRSRRR
jgi:hypothetical protein